VHKVNGARERAQQLSVTINVISLKSAGPKLRVVLEKCHGDVLLAGVVVGCFAAFEINWQRPLENAPISRNFTARFCRRLPFSPPASAVPSLLQNASPKACIKIRRHWCI